jgi:hypothetical protein
LKIEKSGKILVEEGGVTTSLDHHKKQKAWRAAAVASRSLPHGAPVDIFCSLLMPRTLSMKDKNGRGAPFR